MSNSHTPRGPRAVAAEFARADDLVAVVEALTARGYHELDAFVPRPVEALERLLAPRRSRLPRAVLALAVCGAVTALGVQWFCNAWDYPLNVAGRPPFSLPAFIPITFEMMVLFGSVTAFIGVLYQMRLPHLTHTMFEVPGFERASADRFWLYVGADKAFVADAVESLLREHDCSGTHWLYAAQAGTARLEPGPAPGQQPSTSSPGRPTPPTPSAPDGATS